MYTLINPNYFSFCFIGYKAQIETLLSYGTAAKETHLKSSLYFKDEAGCEDENKTASSTDGSSESLVTNTVDDVGDCIPCNDGNTALGEKDELSNSTSNNEEDDDDDDDFMDDDEAEEARRYFGVM